MKKDTHPSNYRKVVFEDLNTGKQFFVRSCASSKETTDVEGEKLPLIKVHVSSDSHPFYTGDVKLVDTEGRVDSFNRRAKDSEKMREQLRKKAVKARKEQESKAEEEADTDQEQPTPDKQPAEASSK